MNQQNIKTKSSLPSSDFFAHYNNSSVARRPTIAEEESIFFVVYVAATFVNSALNDKWETEES